MLFRTIHGDAYNITESNLESIVIQIYNSPDEETSYRAVVNLNSDSICFAVFETLDHCEEYVNQLTYNINKHLFNKSI